MMRLCVLTALFLWLAAGFWKASAASAAVFPPAMAASEAATGSGQHDRSGLDFRRINVELLENADAVIRVDRQDFRQRADLSGKHEHTRIVTIMNRNGLSEAEITLFQALGEQIEHVEAQLYDDRGNFLQQFERQDFEVYEGIFDEPDTDVLELSATIAHHSFPFTLRIRYVKNIEGVSEFPEWQPAGNGTALEKGTYTIGIPLAQRLFAERYPAEHAFTTSVEETATQRRYRWQITQQQSQRRQHNGPPDREIFPTLAVRPLLINKHGYHGRLERWNDVGNWLRSVRFGRHHLLPEDMMLARQLRPVSPELQKLLDMRIDLENIRRISVLPSPEPAPPLPDAYMEKVFSNLQNPDFYETEELLWLNTLTYQARHGRPEVQADQKEKPEPRPETNPPDDMQVFERLLQQVISRVGGRYAARPMPPYDFIPALPRDLVHQSSADADDISYYLRSLLKFAGIEAYQAFLVRDSSYPPAWKEMKEPGLRFDHALTLAIVEGDTLWIDPDNLRSGFPLSYPGYSVSNRTALLLRQDDAVLIQTPRLDADHNRQRRRAEVVLHPEGSAEAEIHTTYTGQQHEFIRRLADMNPAQQEYALFQNLAINEYSFNKIEISASESRPEAHAELNLSISGMANTPGNRLLFRPNLLERRTLTLPLSEPRRQPVHISLGYEDEDTIIYQIPAGYRAEQLPEARELYFPLGFYKAETSLNENGRQIIYRRHLRIERGRIPASGYADYVAFMNAMYRADNREVVLVEE